MILAGLTVVVSSTVPLTALFVPLVLVLQRLGLLVVKVCGKRVFMNKLDPTPCSSNNCTANEECVVNGALSYDCYFKYGYNSTNCTDGNNELVCQNNGNCTTSSNGTVCVCEIGFTGDTCQSEYSTLIIKIFVRQKMEFIF